MSHLFDVYPLFDITPVRAEGSYLWDDKGNRYLDLYGGHAVISIGHSHPRYVGAITDQVSRIGFYSNSVQNPLQQQLAELLGRVSGYPEYDLFLCNSGAEANENALKLASFHAGRRRVIAFDRAFHGRTSGAVAITDNPRIVSPFNAVHEVTRLPLNDAEAFERAINEEVAAVIVEGIQGVGGIRMVDASFLGLLRKKCDETGALLILDEVQSGYGRSGKFFAHQHTDVQPDLITLAKGMGNGFPIGGVLISPRIKPWHGQLGTTFGGNYLACRAAIAVLEVIRDEDLVANAAAMGDYLIAQLRASERLEAVRGQGLMIGFDVPEALESLRKKLLFDHRIFTGASGARTVRLLPSLTFSRDQADVFLQALQSELKI